MPEFVLKTEPEKNIVFASEKLGEEPVTVVLKLTNTAPKDVVFKVKCTSNEMFRIRPPMGILQHMKCETIRLVFNSGKTVPENRKHYFAIYYVMKPEDEAAASKSARELWGEHNGNPEGTRRMYVEFKKEKPAQQPPPEEKAEGAAAAPAEGGAAAPAAAEGGAAAAAAAPAAAEAPVAAAAAAAPAAAPAAAAEGGAAAAAAPAEGATPAKEEAGADKKEGEGGEKKEGEGAEKKEAAEGEGEKKE